MNRLWSVATLLSAITGLLVVVLVSIFASSALSAYLREDQAHGVLSAVNAARNIMSTKIEFRRELTLANLLMEAPEAATPAARASLADVHAQSEALLNSVMREVATRPTADAKTGLVSLRKACTRYRTLFAEVAAAVRMPRESRRTNLLADWKELTTRLSRHLANQSEILDQQIAGADPFVDRMMRINDNAWNMRSNAGGERGLMQTVVIDNRVPEVALQQSLAETKGKVDARWADIEAEAQRSSMPQPLKAAVAKARKEYFNGYRVLRDAILTRAIAGGRLSIDGKQWIATTQTALDSLLSIPATALDLTSAHAKEQAAASQQSFFIAIALMLGSIALACFTVLLVMWRVTSPLKGITRTLTSLTAGDMVAPIPYGRRSDEIGQFARALQMFRDSTVERERLKIEVLENRSAKETAEASSRVKSEFLANMSHELRTPLNAILGFSEILKMQLYGPLGDVRYKEYAEDVHKSGTHLLDLINDVLDLSKIDAGKMELRESIFTISELVDDAVLLVSDKTIDRIRLEVRVPEDIQVLADKRLIKQVLINLLSNAIKFTSEGGTITVGAQKKSGQGLQIYVADTGIGMDALQLDKAFSPYGQIDSRVAHTHRGTGLGLPIAQSLARLHGGDLIGQSTLGQGTRMILHLPENRVVEPLGGGTPRGRLITDPGQRPDVQLMV